MICSLMGWTYQDYVRQPQWFITLIKIKYETEAEFDRAQSKARAK